MNKLLLALALFAAPVVGGKYDRNVEVSVRDTAVSSIEAMNMGGTIETQLRDQLKVGGQYEQNMAKFKPRSLFAKWSSSSGNPMEVEATYNIAGNSAEVEMEYEASGTKVDMHLDTARPNWLRNVGISRGVEAKGRNLNFAPSYNFADRMASLKTRLSLNSDTDVELQLDSNELTSRDALDAKLTLEHNINDRNSIKPMFALKSGDVNYEYTRKLGDDAELVANVNPGNDINVKWEDQGSRGLWTTNINMPWGNPEGSKVSVKRKFSL